ncbi:amidohydrolase family protein [Planctomicrobium piriforme]|uniref:L-fuconolactonase n=1 Tax=Planctomicrobium piriforme TaxID=1576369 RepID=A0A1I3DMK3_9PLAN|nr:amidohydrolase family protein [Planctomicrobium piriforme]SFH87970.1 L-fuconolactonase [Planctomicrobium piriforme]
MTVIDAHQHFWQLNLPFEYEWLKSPEHAPICRDYLPDDLKPHLDRCGVKKSIFVQTQHDLAENRWALSLADHYDFLAGVVGWVDLASPQCEEQLLEFKNHPKFVGIRHITQAEPNPDFIIQPDVMRGMKVLEKHAVPFDMLFFVQHLRHAETVARQVPNLPLVIDHLAKPHIKAQQIDDWLPHLKTAAKCENVCCKLSGMVTEADWKTWKPADLQPYVDHALELFGPERCMYGSDWPVCELAGSYEQVYQATRTCLSKLSETEQAQVFGGTAQKFYELK